jgi:hypothetical protein
LADVVSLIGDCTVAVSACLGAYDGWNRPVGLLAAALTVGSVVKLLNKNNQFELLSLSTEEKAFEDLSVNSRPLQSQSVNSNSVKVNIFAI